jgi:hypothetical protein
MNIDATVTFENNSRLFLINNFFTDDLDTQIFNLYKNVELNPSWANLDTFEHKSGRLVYTGNDLVAEDAHKFGQKHEEELSSLLNKKIALVNVTFWADKPGYTIAPHYDLPYFDHAVQIYMTDPTRNFEMMGTAFYAEDQRYLFEIPYRRNSGYFIDATHNIMHGLHHHIPPDYYRYSVYLKYKTTN